MSAAVGFKHHKREVPLQRDEKGYESKGMNTGSPLLAKGMWPWVVFDLFRPWLYLQYKEEPNC
jgi:hypothetical protein